MTNFRSQARRSPFRNDSPRNSVGPCEPTLAFDTFVAFGRSVGDRRHHGTMSAARVNGIILALFFAIPVFATCAAVVLIHFNQRAAFGTIQTTLEDSTVPERIPHVLPILGVPIVAGTSDVATQRVQLGTAHANGTAPVRMFCVQLLIALRGRRMLLGDVPQDLLEYFVIALPVAFASPPPSAKESFVGACSAPRTEGVLFGYCDDLTIWKNNAQTLRRVYHAESATLTKALGKHAVQTLRSMRDVVCSPGIPARWVPAILHRY